MAQIYRSKITNEYKTQNLVNFHDKVGDDNEHNTIYMMIGRDEPWAQNENDIAFAPPYPDDSPDGQADTWAHCIGLIKIPKEQIKAVLPRRDWGDPSLGDDSLQFDVGDVVVTNTLSVNSHPSALAGYMVYRCIDVPDTGSCSLDDESSTYNKVNCVAIGGKWCATSSNGSLVNIPAGTGDAIDTQDGYLWEYLYTIPPDEVVNSVTQEYIVCPFPEDIVASPSSWGLSNEILYDKDTDRTIFSVGVNRLRFRSKISGSEFPALSDPSNPGYRQISVILNPLLPSEDAVNELEKATDDSYVKDEVELSTGEMIYIENRQPIYRAKDQVEEFSLIFQF